MSLVNDTSKLASIFTEVSSEFGLDILHALKDQPLKYSELYRIVGSDDAVKYHIKNLSDKGIIMKFGGGYKIGQSGIAVLEMESQITRLQSDPLMEIEYRK